MLPACDPSLLLMQLVEHYPLLFKRFVRSRHCGSEEQLAASFTQIYLLPNILNVQNL
jgi:hypothetical protein